MLLLGLVGIPGSNYADDPYMIIGFDGIKRLIIELISSLK